jgi:hypothetical protein
VQRACQLNTLLTVILQFGKNKLVWISCLLLGIDGLGLFLVSIGLDLDSAHVGLDWGVTMKMLIDWSRFMGRWRYPSKQGVLSHLLFRKLGTNTGAQNGRAMVIGIGKKFVFKLFLSNPCNIGGNVEILDTEVGRYEMVRGC